jgi:superoxide dismutase, Fe-Mn family
MAYLNSRRSFIKNTAKATIAASAATVVTSGLLQACGTTKKTTASKFKTPFTQQALSYGYNALEPYIDAKTMEIHFTKHAATYAKNLAEAASAEGINTSDTVENVLASISKYSEKMHNNAGGHYNHELFWKSMKPNGEGKPGGKFLEALETKFKSFADFKSNFGDAAKNRFGSGWSWLVLADDKSLTVTSTPNQDNPLMDIAGTKGTPLLGLDVWEHAYYLKYQNKRADYIDAWWSVVNWQFVEQRYETAIG